MQLSTSLIAMAGSATVAFLAAAPQSAMAADSRVAIQHPAEDPRGFCNKWRCNCVNYVPTDDSLYFKYVLCEPGNFQGKHNTTEALAYCLFTDGSKDKAINKHVAAASGATIGFTQQ